MPASTFIPIQKRTTMSCPGSIMAILLFLAVSACGPSKRDSAAETSSQPAPANVEAIATGQFVDKGGQNTSGSFRVERTGTDLRLVLSSDFQTDEGPDLHVVITPTSVPEAGNDNAMAEGAEVVGKLGQLAGEQVFDLRDDLELDRYNAVVIHCIEFSHIYGAASLR